MEGWREQTGNTRRGLERNAEPARCAAARRGESCTASQRRLGLSFAAILAPMPVEHGYRYIGATAWNEITGWLSRSLGLYPIDLIDRTRPSSFPQGATAGDGHSIRSPSREKKRRNARVRGHGQSLRSGNLFAEGAATVQRWQSPRFSAWQSSQIFGPRGSANRVPDNAALLSRILFISRCAVRRI